MNFASQQIRSTVTTEGELQLSLIEETVSAPGPDEVVVRIDAAPINPSDLGLLFGLADTSTARTANGTAELRVIAEIPPKLRGAMLARANQSLPVGNEGAGVVVAAGENAPARALVGRSVALVGGAMYSQYRKLPAALCQPLPEGITPAQGASWFVNPMTALCMLETMRMEGHSALVHTAAASNLGQMLCRLCLAEGVPLIHIVRRPAQEQLLRELGAVHVLSSETPAFRDNLLDAIAQTGATLAFDAVGGGELASDILSAMEQALSAKESSYSRYGSITHKQVYIYGVLDRSPTVLSRSFGLVWGVGGWLLTPVLQKLSAERVQALRSRAVAGLGSTFASHYTRQVSLTEALTLEAIAVYGKQATGQKFLITPNP